MYIIFCYLAYLTIGLAVTVCVARTLSKSGRTFLVAAFQANRELADSVNRLLVVGFYLIDVGYVTRALHSADQISGAREAIEMVGDKIGLVLIVSGVMHFANLYIFNRLRKRGHAENLPPFPPDARIPALHER